MKLRYHETNRTNVRRITLVCSFPSGRRVIKTLLKDQDIQACYAWNIKITEWELVFWRDPKLKENVILPISGSRYISPEDI